MFRASSAPLPCLDKFDPSLGRCLFKPSLIRHRERRGPDDRTTTYKHMQNLYNRSPKGQPSSISERITKERDLFAESCAVNHIVIHPDPKARLNPKLTSLHSSLPSKISLRILHLTASSSSLEPSRNLSLNTSTTPLFTFNNLSPYFTKPPPIHNPQQQQQQQCASSTSTSPPPSSSTTQTGTSHRRWRSGSARASFLRLRVRAWCGFGGLRI